jgi:hypothetical protein
MAENINKKGGLPENVASDTQYPAEIYLQP